jgi:SAM-dependent methyltransferase
MTMPTSYVYSNDHAGAQAQHDRLAQVLDPHTISLFDSLGIPFPGLRCLEVGYGGGSVATWLAEHGADVTALDVEPRAITAHDRLRVLQHDITTGVPAGPWQLIHARLVLMHLPQREQVLTALADALRPGGALVIEDWDQTWRTGRVLRAPTPADQALWTMFNDLLVNVFLKAGVDPGWASRVPAAMTDAGLVDISATVRCQSWAGGSPGALLSVGSVDQLRDRLLDEGLSDQDLGDWC